MSSSLDMFLRRLSDPRWIPYISSYCDGRCTRCSFTQRCWSHALRQHLESEHSVELFPAGPDAQAQPESHTQGWAERQGVDLNAPELTASDSKAYDRLQQEINNDPVVTRASDYGVDVWKIRDPLLHVVPKAPARTPFAAHVADAVEDVFALALTIGAKVHRAVGSFECDKQEELETDAVQNDANGSAKVARLAIAQSLGAWEIIRDVGVMDAGLVDYLVENLKQIEAEVNDRFPFAMAFVRPGFDEQIPGIVRPWSIMPPDDDDDDDDDDDADEDTHD